MDDSKPLPPEARDAIHAARDHAQAVETARQVQMDNIGDILQERFEHVLARGTEQEKSIILARVPYICQDIKNINAALEQIKQMIGENRNDLEERDKSNAMKYVNQDQFSPVKMIVYGLVTLALTGVGGALLTSLFK